jgi:riboflavin kinase/FMN adenylyltransferase
MSRFHRGFQRGSIQRFPFPSWQYTPDGCHGSIVDTMATPTAVLIGNFDGVHTGHRHLIDVARSLVSDQGRVVAIFFDPHPATLVRPESVPPMISTPEDRRALLVGAGVDHVEVIKTTPEFLEMSPEAFLHWLVSRYTPQWIVEGRDFRFGRGRSGTVETLTTQGVELGFQVKIVDPVEVFLQDQSAVVAKSSTARWLIEQGRVGDARCILERSHRLSGRVQRGSQWGRRMGIPTANLGDVPVVIPAEGIYAGRATDDQGKWHDAAISVGTRPTFGDHPRVVEVHLCECSMSLESYDWQMDVEIVAWIRDQVTYDDHTALVDQMRRDIATCGDLLGEAHRSGAFVT